jgi:hypothetical protein
LQIPETAYAQRPDGVNIAYQLVGTGPLVLIVSPGFVWESLSSTETGLVGFEESFLGVG